MERCIGHFAGSISTGEKPVVASNIAGRFIFPRLYRVSCLASVEDGLQTSRSVPFGNQRDVQKSTNDREPSSHSNSEFDFLLSEFSNMQHQIGDLFKEVQQKEKIRADLEVEKLLYQINPHFLMNTLDTVHWLAVMNGQGEIDKLVQSLNKLLYYNLGKLGQVSTMEEEIDALRQYLILQQIRYDFEFDVRITADEQVLQIPVPRFILQPLVENSLYHGLSDEGFIQIEVTCTSTLNIMIQDNGAGMTEETIHNLLNNRVAEQQKVGMGIGLNYVHRMLKAQYGDQAQLVIE